jgi:hypothetical protein
MSLAVDPTIRNLNDCGCCEGLGMQAPEVLDNRPGLSAIAYRVGTHSRFKATMLARLSSADLPALNGLTTRSDGDLSIALLDAWAVVADVLTFYQERIANESYLRTATERRSLVELAKLIGYVPRPGVAASAYLAFTLDNASTAVVAGADAPGTVGSGISASAPGDVLIPVGTRVQSIPGPGEKPQVFETVEAVTGRSEWNAMKPVLVQKHPALTEGTQRVILRGTGTNLRKGDSLLLRWGTGDADRVVKRVIDVAPDPAAKTTRVDLAEDPPDPPPFKFLYLAVAIWQPAAAKLTTESVRSNVLSGSWKQADLKAYAAAQRWSLPRLNTNLIALAGLAVKQMPKETGIFAFRQRASIFGYNAPSYSTLPANQRVTDYVTGANGALVPQTPPYPEAKNWEGRKLSQEPGAGDPAIDLDQAYPGIVKGSWVVLEDQYKREAYQVLDNTELTRTDFTLTGKVSRIRLSSSAFFSDLTLRNTTVLAQSEKLELAELPITDVIKGDRIVLGQPYLGLQVGRPVVVTGKRTDLDGVTDSEVLFLAEVVFSEGYTELAFVNSLEHEYERASVTINANVALATHGETKIQALGSGDASQSFQRFTLPESPLTYVAAENAKGAVSTLEVRVNHVLWQEVDFFYGHGPEERIYITRTDDERTTVQFGDGRTGTRVPTGQENVTASYRKGMGAGGLVGEAQLSLLLTKPLGLRGVVNPVGAGDAADPESRDDVRRNAALPTRTLDRIVSLRDYEDFARAFSGVAKTLATWTWNGRERGVFVTVAGTGSKPIEPGSLTYKNLLAAMLQAGDPTVPLRVKSYRPAFFRVACKLRIDPAHLVDLVKAAVETALRAAFSFDAREFGQPVAKSEVIAAIQAVKGVLAVDLDGLYRTDATEEELAKSTLFDTLVAEVPRAGTSVTVAAELLLLDPRPVALGVMTG